MSATPPLSASEGYALWAETYDKENVLSTLDEQAIRQLAPALPIRTLLDAACGTGRRIVPCPEGVDRAFGIDFSFEMLRAGKKKNETGAMAAADLRALPFCEERFDLVWCRLAVGHMRNLPPLYTELARVTAAGAHVILTDFHPSAVRAGHRRTFRDSRGVLHTVEHTIHELEAHKAAARNAGLSFDALLELAPGEKVRHFYEKAGKLEQFSRDSCLPLLLALRFTR